MWAKTDAAHAQASPAVMARLDASPQMQSVHELAGRTFASIAGDLLLSPRQIDALLDPLGVHRERWISTDNNLKLEYSTPKANANPPDRSFEVNLRLLRTAQK
ncbi:hypothetical protein [Glaciimonas sp. PCH181]|uniref:hypothetical protein n=1 Tax=Glaciimonas sp. PCH181 TaxID=2133943 RepID=UPI000D3BF14A|nr:hypothetical protein [Glaciimonas sp. PCH181]PUA17861.1 hypothetical protein C7W93_18565 [Glaciimonas sp. PCH181]